MREIHTGRVARIVVLGVLLVVAACTGGVGDEPLPGGNPPGTPQINLPSSGAVISQPTTLSVSGSGIASVHFEVNGATLLDVASPPFQTNLYPSHYENGPVMILIRVTLDDGSTMERSAEVTIYNAPPPPPVGSEETPFVIKDTSGIGAVDHPVTAVIPFPYGAHQSTSGFRIVDAFGDTIPAQFEVLNRWWARDGSIRHVAVHFQATVPSNGDAAYTLWPTGGSPAPALPVQVHESTNEVVVDTGVLRFRVKQNGFNLFDEAWLDTNGDGAYSASERMVAPDSQNGPVFTGRLSNDIQRASARSDIRMVVEETGPMRAVIRLSGLTHYESATNHTHGFALRIYAYAGKSFVKVDYQLQNSAKNKKFSWPLYFEDVSIRLAPSLSNPTVRFAPVAGDVWSGSPGSGVHLYQSSLTDTAVRTNAGSTLVSRSHTAGTPSYAWADLSDSNRGVFVAIRNMAEMWPNGIEADSNGALHVRLWPQWGSQLMVSSSGYSTTTTGLYWLDDMQHVVKEMCFYFHGASASDGNLDALAKTMQAHPVPIVPLSVYYDTRATLDLSGILPSATETVGGTDPRKISWSSSQTNPSSGSYSFGWCFYGGNTGRRNTNGGGGYPHSFEDVIATEHAAAWLRADVWARAELNTRPVWMEGYTYADDYDLLRLTDQPYATSSWRASGSSSTLDAPYLSGTSYNMWHPWDDQHSWTYHIEQAYYFTANPWIRDWCEFMKEFRKPDMIAPRTSSTRGNAHQLGSALQAYRVTGDPDLLDKIRTRIGSLHSSRFARYGIWHATATDWEGIFQVGFLSRNLIQLLDEIRDYDDQTSAVAWNILWGCMEWNYHHAQYAYYIDSSAVAPGGAPSGGPSTTLTDPAAWFGMYAGRPEILDQMNTYINEGLNGGVIAYDMANYGVVTWTGGYLGRVVETSRLDEVVAQPPGAITDLSASYQSGKVRLTWTTPSGASRFHVVWSETPISTTWTPDPETQKLNAWACNAVGTSLEGVPGTTQSIEFGGVPGGKRIYAAVFCFAENHHMGAGSNVADVTIP